METLSHVSPATEEIREGRRFGFGQNWCRYLDLRDEDRIRTAQHSLLNLLGMKQDSLRFREQLTQAEESW